MLQRQMSNKFTKQTADIHYSRDQSNSHFKIDSCSDQVTKWCTANKQLTGGKGAYAVRHQHLTASQT